MYYIEANPKYLSFLNAFFRANSKGDFLIVTSTITLLEVLVHPLRLLEVELAQKYENILRNSTGIELISTRAEIAVKAAELRAKSGLRTPDAIQIATALWAGADYFLSNDKELKRIKEIEVLMLSG
ncbi:MAG: type II toxin-antitoxin system VapC family toxin [SAR324 cluster bacterium]|uniref:Type II toxin-antitoxin system VapC family toxin n=1 Tax=SAR324 cluster bacterium TaxID=2024889 RepID=A0A7X9IMI3_9DELT|nr:type II toxin-antitoxin system VapC family toxin [SAR324 cluster bacterium]